MDSGEDSGSIPKVVRGQMHRMTPNPITSTTGMAYNGTDHFATFTPDITVEQRELAHRVLELALNDEDLPEGWN